MNFFKNNKYLITIFVIILFLLSVITFSAKLRRNILWVTVKLVNTVQYERIDYYIKFKNYDEVSSRILKYINFSQKFSPGKNSMFEEIYNITEKASSNIISQDNFNKMEKVYLKIDTISDDIYKNNVWLARALSDNNIDKSFYHLNKAIELSSSSEDVYREILRLYFENNENNILIKKYCKNYFESFYGGKLDKNDINYLYGSNNEFIIFFNNNLDRKYVKFVNKLNGFTNYEFNTDNNFKIQKISIIKSFFNGSVLTLKNFIVHGKNKIYLSINDLNFVSKTSYVLNDSNNQIVFLNTKENDDKIDIYFNKEYNDVLKISFNMKLQKLALTKNTLCK